MRKLTLLSLISIKRTANRKRLIMDLSTFIANTAFFNGLPASCCAAIAACTTLKKYAKNDMLFSEGKQGSTVYILASGLVRLSKMSQDGTESVVRLIQPGAMFAEVILFESPNYPVTAVALTPSELACIHRADLRRQLSDQDFRDHFIAMLFRKQRQLTQRLQELTTMNTQERFFLFIRSHYGAKSTMTIQISKKEIAAAMGVTPECFSRLIKQLKDDGSIEWDGKELRILTPLHI